MTDQPMDYRDYLIRQHQQERMAQQWGEWGASVIDNILGASADKYLSVAHGWVALLPPLPPGTHTITIAPENPIDPDTITTINVEDPPTR